MFFNMTRKRFLAAVLVFLFIPMTGNADEKNTSTRIGSGSDTSGTRPGLNPDGPLPDDRYFTMNFQDVDINAFIRFISEITGKNFLIDPGIKGNVTVLSPGKVSVAEAYKVFLSVLEVHGYTAVPSGNFIKIISSADARMKGIETFTRNVQPNESDNLVTQLIPLKYGQAAEFVKFFRPLIAKSGILMAYPDTNTLVVTDVQSNIHRLVSIVNELDIPGDKEKISIFAVEEADAEKLATKLSGLFQSTQKGKPASEPVKIIADERTNSLIVMASPHATEEIREMLKVLDRKIVQRRGSIHTYSLQHAVAEDVAKVLTEIPGEGTGEGKEGKDKKIEKRPSLSKDVKITADAATNTLIIIAEPEEYQILEEIIKILDVPRTMVFVEALIIEVAASKSLELGVEWRLGDEFNGGLNDSGGIVVGGVQSDTANVDVFRNLAEATFPSGFSAGVVGRAITLGDVIFPTIAAFVRAVRTDNDFNIISTPQILTLDNQEAVIEVGQNIPFVTSVVQETAITDRPIQSFEYRDVGVTLKVTPHINDNRGVRLEVEESIKSVVESTALGGAILAPTTTFRTARTSITVKDGETAVIGGLMQNRMDRGKTQVPCLGGIPGLGWLFKQTSDRDEKTNLMVFLAPHIVENPQEVRALYEGKKGAIDREVEKSSKHYMPERIRRKGFE